MREYESNTAALRASLERLDEDGKLSDVNAAQVKALRTLAAALDGGSTNSQLFKEYREGWRELVGDEDGKDDSASDLLASIRNGKAT